eukprot:COSAG02_NODE_3195_length_7193_cov_1.529462_3_plen_92_part_00
MCSPATARCVIFQQYLLFVESEDLITITLEVYKTVVAAGLKDAGGWSRYDWPQQDDAGSTSPDMEVHHTWVTIPKGSSADGNGVFASSQYW